MAPGRLIRTKTRRGRRILENRDPKPTENDKNALIVRGGKTNEIVTTTLSELYALKKPLAKQLRRRNPFHPFEDDTPIEKFSMKFDSSLFVFGSNSKKHPNSLIFGRMYDYHVLDMVELRVDKLIASSQFNNAKTTLGTKPCIILQGIAFESDQKLKRIANIMVDWFRGAVVEKIRLQGLELVIALTAIENKVLLRTYRVCLKKSASTLPRIELVEIGPRIDFSVQRTKFASDDLFKTALKQPKQLTAKMRKNFSEDVFGTKLGRIHVGRQNVDTLQTRKMKALGRGINKNKDNNNNTNNNNNNNSNSNNEEQEQQEEQMEE